MSETQPSTQSTTLEIIAEVGCNHKGDLDLALEYVGQAKSCGADTVKFQSFKADKLVNPGDIYDFCKQAELGYEEHAAIIEECENNDIKPLFSVFDHDSLVMLKTLGLEEVKVPSGQVFNQLLLAGIAGFGMKAYVSTGMCSLGQVWKSYKNLIGGGLKAEDIVLMQCTSAYPAPPEDANLRVIQTYKETFECQVGYSDHVPGWVASTGAVVMGASVIEKHFILNPNDDTPDACVSLSPVMFQIMCMNLRDAAKCAGTQFKRPRASEQKMFHRRDYGEKND